MRVYGASPLYNYVELVFRSKRLFILSIVVCTAIVSILTSMKAKQYTATALVLLSGNPNQAGFQALDESQLGSIKYKLNILNIKMKDPNFFRDAMRDGKLDRAKNGSPLTAQEFDKFYKDVMKAVTVANGENVLEITCRWPDDRAAEIVNAFYDAYARVVLDQETISSTNQTKLLENLLADYTKNLKDIEKKVENYKIANIKEPLMDADSSSQRLQALERAIAEYKVNLQIDQQRLSDYKAKIQTVPQKIDSKFVSGSPSDDSGVQDARRKMNETKEELDRLRDRYQDSHPYVQKALITHNDAVAIFKRASASVTKNRPVTSITTNRNPEYDRMAQTINDLEISIQAQRSKLALQEQNYQVDYVQAQRATPRQNAFRWLTDKYQLINQIHNNILTRLEDAKLKEKRERELSLAEMTMMVKPEPELEMTGMRNLLMYAAGPILGIIIAFAFALVTETLDHSLRTPVEVEKHLGKPVLAVLPRMDPPKPRKRGGAPKSLGGGPGSNRPSISS